MALTGAFSVTTHSKWFARAAMEEAVNWRDEFIIHATASSGQRLRVLRVFFDSLRVDRKSGEQRRRCQAGAEPPGEGGSNPCSPLRAALPRTVGLNARRPQALRRVIVAGFLATSSQNRSGQRIDAKELRGPMFGELNLGVPIGLGVRLLQCAPAGLGISFLSPFELLPPMRMLSADPSSSEEWCYMFGFCNKGSLSASAAAFAPFLSLRLFVLLR